MAALDNILDKYNHEYNLHTQVCQHPSASVKDNVLVVHEPRTQRDLSLCITEIKPVTLIYDPTPTHDPIPPHYDRPAGGIG